ncbi:mate-domain-containing protein [Truncatella angustata]|uniref:Mate-domain-containing protein n=1 Tax=Truncatella angustata TaxID=152316 RepID=A0A9P8UWB1_9PEZI|nr:mate-domain-containing protein [Truncatella angustata]KAH6659363.1 mate-domain-containing protein [Truncatella angustata]
MSNSRDVPGRKPSLLGIGDLATSLASSFMPGSPLAQEIVARDVAECSDEDDEDINVDTTFDSDDSDAESYPGHDGGGHHGGPTLYRQPQGIAFGGTRRPSVLPEVMEAPVVTRVEKKQSRAAERSLLRDNHILPPKHVPEKRPGLPTRVYKKLFSTKVRKPLDDEEMPTEESPLLPDRRTSGALEHERLNETWEAAVASGKIQTTWQREAQTIAKYSRSLIVTFLLQYSISIASVFAVGRIGTVELGAVSLATMTANITCYAPFQGLATSLDTLCSQAYGSGHKQLVGLQVQRMVYFLATLLVPVAILWSFAGDILVRLVPEPEAAELAGVYLKIVLAGVPGFICTECGKRFVNAQGLFQATTWVLIIAAPFNVLISYLFVWHFGWGFIGAPIAVAVSQNLIPLLLFLYVVFIDGSQCWGGFSKKALMNWGPMVKLALPGMVMVVAEWLAFEVLTLASSQFGTKYLAAQSILMTLTSTTFQLPFPISIAASTRVANLIGAKLANAARTSAKVAVFAAGGVAIFNVILLSSLRYELPKLLTTDEEVIDLVAQMMFLVAVMQIFDAMAAMAHGLLRGIGKQHFGGYANLFAYYAIALPISFGTAFGLDWKLEGLWAGVTLGLFLVAAVEYWYIYTSDWEQSVREAEHRNAAG